MARQNPRRRAPFARVNRVLRPTAVITALTLLVLALGLVAPAAPLTPTAAAAPGSPGTEQAPLTVLNETFENGQGTGSTNANNYTGTAAATGSETYTAAPYWLTNCNGIIVSGASTATSTSGNACNASVYPSLRSLATLLGQLNGTSTPSANHAVTAYTDNSVLPDSQRELETVTARPLASANRFVTFRLNYAAVSCNGSGGSSPVLQFAYLDADGNATTIPGSQPSCPSSGAASGSGTFTSTPVLYPGTSVGVRVLNLTNAYAGNNGAIDDLQILDTTPQLDQAFSPTAIGTGGTSTLTYTITNTTDDAAKPGFRFVNALPSGVSVASNPGYATTCTDASASGNTAGSTSLTFTGSLAAGVGSCTVTVNVTSDAAGHLHEPGEQPDAPGPERPGRGDADGQPVPVLRHRDHLHPERHRRGLRGQHGRDDARHPNALRHVQRRHGSGHRVQRARPERRRHQRVRRAAVVHQRVADPGLPLRHGDPGDHDVHPGHVDRQWRERRGWRAEPPHRHLLRVLLQQQRLVRHLRLQHQHPQRDRQGRHGAGLRLDVGGTATSSSTAWAGCTSWSPARRRAARGSASCSTSPYRPPRATSRSP